MEDLQSRNKVICLNSKLDFIQPFKTHLQVQRGSKNSAPGETESKQGPVGHFSGPPIMNFKSRQHKRKAEIDGRQKEDNHLKRRRMDEADSTIEFIANINRERCSTPNPDETHIQTNRKRRLDDSELATDELIQSKRSNPVIR